MGLSERQTDAAHRLGQDVCVVAGPGSGKTSVLIERFSWLVRERGVSPRRILAITFTEKAATEIRQRMIRAFEGDLRMRQEIERAWVSTIHAFCARLLRENAIEAAIDPSFTVLEQSKLALQEAADQALESMYKDSPGSVRTFLRSLAVATEREGYVPDLASSLIEIYQAIRLAGTPAQNLLRPPVKRPDLFARMQTIAQEVAAERTPTRSPNQAQVHASAHDWCREVLALGCDEVTEAHLRSAQRENWNKHHMVKRSVAHRHEDELRALCAEAHRDFLLHYYARERAMIAEAIGRIDRLYRERKRGSSMLDFDDLEEAAILLLENDLKLRERIRETFDYVLMDELQDTNPLQWRLMELVRREHRFFAVGDINQSIYGFRHARPDLYGNYRRGLEKAGLAVDELRDNYRSRPDLLETINRIFAGAPGIEPHELIAGRPFAEKPSGSVEFIAAFAENTADAERIEALWVAKRIVEIVGQLPLSGGPAKFGDIAILTRANYSTAELQLALDKFGVPSVVVGGLTFFDAREVRDLSLLLSVLVNPRNEVALAGLLRSPMFGMSDEDLLRLAQHGTLLSGLEANPPPAWKLVEELRKLRNLISPDRLLRRAIDECDYESELTDRGRSNVNKYLSILRERYSRDPMPLSQLAAGIEDLAAESEAPPSDYGDAVRLMTMHKAKGLEFPVVFLPFLHKGRSYGFPIISFTHEFGLGVKWRNPLDGTGVGDSVWSSNRTASQRSEAAEENRLLYVGCTRAGEHLVLSSSVSGNERGTWPKLVANSLGIDLGEPPANEELRKDAVRVFTTDRAPRVPRHSVGARAFSLPASVDSIGQTSSAYSSASVTDVSQFAECPRKFYLGRYLRYKKSASGASLLAGEEDDLPDHAEASPLEIGIEVHALLSGSDGHGASQEAKELAARFHGSPLAARLSRASRKEYEWDFLLQAGGLVLRGQIDLWFEHGRELILVDYKTDRNPDVLAIEGHSLQLRIYAAALSRAVQRKVDRAVLYFLRANRELDVDVSPLAIGASMDKIHEFREALSSLVFALHEGEHCRRCEFFRGACPAQGSLFT